VIDVSDRERVEDDLILAREDAVNANRAKSVFLANMSHEIRTPMNGILSMSEVALSAQGLSDELERYLRTIHSSAASLITILDDVLDLSRIEADRRMVEKEPFRPAELIHTVEAMFGPNMTEKQLSLHFEVTGTLSDVLVGDRNRLRQILVNLLSNAITYSDAGEITLRVSESEVSGFIRELTFEVHDTGPGIDPTEQQRIRTLFQQSNDAVHQRYEGAGLGLAISRRLAALLGGQLYFETDRKTGTRFFCSVPLELPGEDETVADIERGAPAPEDGGCRRILVAEDNAINLLVIRTVLEKENYEVVSVSNGQDALDALQHVPFDLVLMDISMHGMDGITATRTIRSHAEGLYDPAVPVIAISAHSMKGDRERFLAAGMNDYISKPFVRETVLSVIKRHLGSDQ
jgi:CheY-like chemotaxis protein